MLRAVPRTVVRRPAQRLFGSTVRSIPSVIRSRWKTRTRSQSPTSSVRSVQAMRMTMPSRPQLAHDLPHLGPHTYIRATHRAVDGEDRRGRHRAVWPALASTDHRTTFCQPRPDRHPAMPYGPPVYPRHPCRPISPSPAPTARRSEQPLAISTRQPSRHDHSHGAATATGPATHNHNTAPHPHPERPPSATRSSPPQATTT